jgi:hypothetical protein
MTDPSADTSAALLFPPRPTIPVLGVQRNASLPDVLLPVPTTVEPLAEMPVALLLNEPPGRSPRPMKNGSAAFAVSDQMNHGRTPAMNAEVNFIETWRARFMARLRFWSA